MSHVRNLPPKISPDCVPKLPHNQHPLPPFQTAHSHSSPHTTMHCMHCHRQLTSPGPRANTHTAVPVGVRNCPSPHRQRGSACQAAPIVFEPQVDSQAVAAQLVVLSATAATAAYWWLGVVPTARRTLAKEKRSGPLNEYLVDLQSNPGRRVERWFYTDWLQQLQRRQDMSAAAAAKRASLAQQQSSRAQESLSQPQQPLEQMQPPISHQRPAESSNVPPEDAVTEADDKMPSFWSLDNPILATAALLASAALVSSILSH